MNPRAYYNEFDPHAAAWLRNLIAAGLIAPGEVDTRSIVDVRPDDERRRVLLEPVGYWTAGRKERLLAAIVEGIVSQEDACRAHNISEAELDEWARKFIASRTFEGLQATRRLPPDYRKTEHSDG